MILMILMIIVISINRYKENFDDKSEKKIERLIEKFNKLNRDSLHKYPACITKTTKSCLTNNNINQIIGNIYKVHDSCYKALSACNGCLNDYHVKNQKHPYYDKGGKGGENLERIVCPLPLSKISIN